MPVSPSELLHPRLGVELTWYNQMELSMAILFPSSVSNL